VAGNREVTTACRLAGGAPVRCGRAGSTGFTLIELMIVVAVAAIIAMIAIPSYQDYVLRSKRAAARQVLMEATQYLERNYTAAGCYNFANTPACLAQSGSATAQPSTLVRAPSEGRQSYEVSWSFTNSGQAYTLTATPCASASCPSGAETTFADQTCGALCITQTGFRGVWISGSCSGTATTISTCWQR
jgi:type IV pilus assembly protein PilE